MADEQPIEFGPIPGLHDLSDNDPLVTGKQLSEVDRVADRDWYAGEPPPDEIEPEFEDEAAADRGEGARPEALEAGAGGVPVFATLEEWVETYLLNVYRRSVDGTAMTWCPEWWRHPEAYLRLDALWRAWEYLRQQPGTGMAVWMRDYADPHMQVLLSESGPFKGCEPTRHSSYELRPLPMLAPPSWETLTAAYVALRSREWQEDE
jgi:hypothetical protein